MMQGTVRRGGGRPVMSLPLGPGLREKLHAAGFQDVHDLEGMLPLDLAREAKVSFDEALLILRSFSAEEQLLDVATAADFLHKEKRNRRITTFCKELDDLLGRGVTPGETIEFCGVPGIGKTQLGMQLALNTQIPLEFGGVAGEAIYIDTEGSFMVERYEIMAEALLVHLSKTSRTEERRRAAANVTLESLLSGLHYVRIHDYTEQIAVVRNLFDFIREKRQTIRLIVLDSITFHFRQDFDSMPQRTRLLLEMCQSLQKLAYDNNIAVVVVNQVTTKMMTGERAKLVPALGESWAHCATTRIMLEWERDQRMARLLKSPSLVQDAAPYNITEEGIRGSRPTKRPREEENLPPLSKCIAPLDGQPNAPATKNDIA